LPCPAGLSHLQLAEISPKLLIPQNPSPDDSCFIPRQAFTPFTRISPARMTPLAGELTLFEVDKFKYPVFTSGDLSSTKCIAFIGGLTAGLGTIPYAAKLSAALEERGWKL
jgi:hypothetical protein